MRNGLWTEGLVCGIIVLFVGVSIVSAFYGDSSVIIKPTNHGNWLYVGGNGSGNYSKIQDAINNASNGETIYVYSQFLPYYENLLINKSITLIGENKDTTIIDGSGLGNVVMLFGNASSTKISNFTIQHSNTNGIFIGYNLSNVKISQNIIQECYLGVHCWHATTSNITGNIIRNNTWGVLFEFTDHSQISFNHVENNPLYGVIIDASPVNKVYSNEIKNNGEAFDPSRSIQNEIYQNNFIDNQLQAFWQNSLSKWHDNYWSDLNQHFIKKIYIIIGAFIIIKSHRTIYFINIDPTPHSSPYSIS